MRQHIVRASGAPSDSGLWATVTDLRTSCVQVRGFTCLRQKRGEAP